MCLNRNPQHSLLILSERVSYISHSYEGTLTFLLRSFGRFFMDFEDETEGLYVSNYTVVTL